MGLTISLILCTLSVLSFIGMLEKVWKRVSSLKLVKTWPLLKRIMKKLVLTPWKPKVMKEMNTNQKKKISLINTKPAGFHQLAILDNSINIFFVHDNPNNYLCILEKLLYHKFGLFTHKFGSLINKIV